MDVDTCFTFRKGAEMRRQQCRTWCVTALTVAIVVWVPFAMVVGVVHGVVLLAICGLLVLAERLTVRKKSKNHRKIGYIYTSQDLLEVLDDQDWMTEKEIRLAMWQRAKSFGRIHSKWGKAPSYPLVWDLLQHNVEDTRCVKAERRALDCVSTGDGGLWRYRRDKYVLPLRSFQPFSADTVRPS
jgi:hypothetical protein